MTNSNLTIINVKQLVGILPKEDLILAGLQMNKLSTIEDAFIEIREDKIHDFGL